jgi:Selenocysteine lyase
VEARMARLSDFRLGVEEIERLVDERTRLVAVSAVDFGTGQRRPLADIGAFCRSRGIIFCVDAVQALGAVTIDVVRDMIDCLAADGHKWLCAPEGCGCLFVARRIWDEIRPARIGWKSVVDDGRYLPYHFQLKANALKFEPGSLNLLSIHALGAALDLVLEAGPQAVEEAVLNLTRAVRHGLERRGYDIVSPGGEAELSGITTFRGLADPKGAEEALRKSGIVVRARLGGLRVSPHFYCRGEEIQSFLSALDRLAEAGQGEA